MASAAAVVVDAAVEEAAEDDDDGSFPKVVRDKCTYTSCYCEENVWKLVQCKELAKVTDRLYVVFISNPNKTVPLWSQRAAEANDVVVWDYHVIAILKAGPSQPESMVYDLDTTVDFPVTLQHYLYATCPVHTSMLQPQFRRRFRVVAAPHFVPRFASDRSHMALPGGKWNAPPPKYDCIVATKAIELGAAVTEAPSKSHNLDVWWSMEAMGGDVAAGAGAVVDLKQLCDMFGAHLPRPPTKTHN